MATISSSSSNKKKRKVTELIDYWQHNKTTNKSNSISAKSDRFCDLQDTDLGRQIKRAKSVDELEEQNGNKIETDPQQMKPELKSSASRPKLSAGNSSERRLRERQRNEAANEIYSSEKSYVANIETFVTNFGYPLVASKSGLITEQERQFIFGDIEMILQLNKAFLVQVSDRMRLFTSKTPLSDIFLSFMPHFKMYTTYCSKYVAISEMINRLKMENKGFKSYLKKAESHCKHMMADFLIAPVQRIPRLSLLIESLLKFTDPVHPDWEGLQEALNESQKVARLINDKMKEVEGRQKVVSIHKSFDPMLDDFLEGPLVQPHRVFVKEGVLARKSNGTKRVLNEDDAGDFDFSDSDSEESDSEKQEECEKGKYYIYLFNDLILVGTSVGKGKTKRLVYETSFDLCTTFIKEDMNPLCFQLVNPRCTYVWLAQSQIEVEDWKNSITENAELLVKTNPSLASQRNRVKITLDEDTNEWSAEILATTRGIKFDAQSYREEVLANTQKHLTQFMHEHHEVLAKHKVVMSPNKQHRVSMLQRVRDSFTPKKRHTGSFIRHSQSIVSLGGPDNVVYQSAVSFSLVNPGSPISSSVYSSPSNYRKSEKFDFTSVEEMDGISCLNRHLEYLNQELQEVRQIRRKVKIGDSSNDSDGCVEVSSRSRTNSVGSSNDSNNNSLKSLNGSNTAISTPTRRPINRIESMKSPNSSASPLLKQTLSTCKLSSNLSGLSNSPRFAPLPAPLRTPSPRSSPAASKKLNAELPAPPPVLPLPPMDIDASSTITNITSTKQRKTRSSRTLQVNNQSKNLQRQTLSNLSAPGLGSENQSVSSPIKSAPKPYSSAFERRQTVDLAQNPMLPGIASPVALSPRAVDTNQIGNGNHATKRTKSVRKSRVSLGGAAVF